MSTAVGILDWSTLGEAERRDALRRPAQQDAGTLVARARRIVEDVRARGDAALRDYTASLDGAQLDTLAVTPAEFDAATASLAKDQLAALRRAIETVTRFHETQSLEPVRVQTSPGVTCERTFVPIGAVGLYVPAGTAPLPSTAIMLAIPARLARCPVRVMCTPPRSDGRADPAVLSAARLCGIEQVFKVGGAQAVAAMAYGTETIPKVDKIFGPGNAWVTEAKQRVAADPEGAACDLPAGPSEVLVIADDSARAELVASDLLAQAEHDVLSQAVLLSPSAPLAEAVVAEVERQCRALSRRAILERSLAASRAIVVPDLATAMAVSNDYAPEHLILQVREPRRWLPEVRSAGSVFLGQWSPEPLGDYCSGTNHVLPTYGYARAYSGLSVLDFVKRITVQELTAEGLACLGPIAVELARLEGLDAHASAVERRLALLGERK